MQSINGIMFYSPNCSDTVSAPRPSPDRGWEHNPIIDYHNNLTPLVNNPQWWTSCFGWLSFIPKRPVFGGGLLGRLADICIDKSEGKYSMSEDVINSWKKLEYIICNVITTLGGKYKLPAMAPAYFAARGYRRQHAYRSVAHQEARASRDIFVLWIGLLSFLIAGADSLSENDWPSLLQNNLRFHHAIADLIRASDLGTFSHEVQRVGAFIYLTKDDIKKTHQPSVHWLIAHNIPIWYQWDEDEIKWAKHDPIFAQFGPPQSGGIPESPANPLGSSATRGNTITWREFFERHEESRPRLLNLETALERERHLNRERNPPLKLQRSLYGTMTLNSLVEKKSLPVNALTLWRSMALNRKDMIPTGMNGIVALNLEGFILHLQMIWNMSTRTWPPPRVNKLMKMMLISSLLNNDA